MIFNFILYGISICNTTTKMSSSIYGCVEKGPAIEVFALNRAFLEDTHPQKANLGVGGKFLLFFY